MKTRLWRRSYTSLIVANSLVTVSYTMFTSLLPLYVHTLGYNNKTAGDMAAGLGVTLMLSKLLAGAFIDRSDKRRFLICSTILVLFNSVGYCFASDIKILYLLRLLNGLSNALFIVASSTLIAFVAEDAQLEDAISYYRITSSLTVAIGPAAGNYLYLHYGFSALFQSMVLLVAVSLVAVLFVCKQDIPETAVKTRASFKEAFKPAALVEFSALPASLAVLFLFISTSSTSNYLVAYGNAQGITKMSLFFFTNCIFMLLARALHKLLARRMNEKLLLTLGMGFIAAALVSISFAKQLWAILLIGAIFGLGDGITTPLLNTMALRKAPASRKGTASATFSLANGIGTSIGADIWGSVSENFGYPAVFQGAAFGAVLEIPIMWFVLQ